MITKRDQLCYHVGVDTIDAFCYSRFKKLTEKELDQVFKDFCVTRNILVQQDEKDSATGLFAGLI